MPKVSVKSYSRKALKEARKEAKAHPRVEHLLKRIKFREQIISKNDHQHRALKEKFLKEQEVESMALKLFEQYKVAGVTWAACVQAVKSKCESSFQIKWAERSAGLKRGS